MKKIHLLLFSFFIFTKINAQQIHRCYTTEYVEYLSQSDSNLKLNIQNTFDAAKLHVTNQMSLKSTAPSTIYRIPVVVHIVYNTTNENINDSLIYNQINVLNKDYRKLNADTVNYRPIFKDRAADVGFEFFLATIDPDGNPTTGITRTSTNTTSFQPTIPDFDLDKMKFNNTGGIDAWDTDNYLNIWVCNTGGSILGFAYPPEIAPNWPNGSVPSEKGKWGVVISYEVFGYKNPLATGFLSIADQGRTAVHEIGHYFGLRHIWGDPGFGVTPCSSSGDDGIDDTPNMAENSQTTGCDFNKNTCTNGETPDEPDMPENYMDYSEETCQNMFTQGQADLMQSMAITGRPDLAAIISDENISVEMGDYIVVNGTDTILVDANTLVTIQTGDEILFLNENNGYAYTASNNGFLNGTDDYAVTETGEITVFETNSINNIIANNHLISIFPNPSNSNFSLSNQSAYELTKIILTNIEGKRFTYNANNLINNSIEVSHLENGLYFVSLYEGEKLFSVKKLSILK